MEIKLAVESDIIEVMYFFRECAKYNIKQGLFHWNYHHPSYQDILSDVINQELYFRRDRFICTGVIAMNTESSDKFAALAWEDNNQPLIVKYFAVHPHWYEKEVGDELLVFANKKALDEDFSSIHADAYHLDTVHMGMLEKSGFKEIGEYLKQPQMFPYKAYEKEL